MQVKKIATRLIRTVLAGMFVCICLTGCTPGGYSKEAVKQIKEEYSDDAANWFAVNLPEAKVKSAEAAKDTRDLFSAITGTYSVSSGTYT